MKYYEVSFHIIPMTEVAGDILSALLGEVGFETFSTTDTGVDAFVQQTMWNEDAVNQVLVDFPLADVKITYSVQEAPDEDWNQAWEETFRPINLDKLVCIHDHRFPADEGVQYDICINPRLAFGTGSHQTTRMLLRALTSMELKGKRVIDAGTGTGILAILCAMREAKDVFAYDIDEWSVNNALENAALNNCGEQILIRLGDASVLEDVCQRDLLIANINRNILLADMPRFVETLNKGGRLLLSGFYVSDAQALLDAASAFGFQLEQQWTDEEWCALCMVKTD